MNIIQITTTKQTLNNPAYLRFQMINKLLSHFANVEIICFNFENNSIIKKVAMKLFFWYKIKRKLKEKIKRLRPSAIVITTLDKKTMNNIKKICKTNDIKLIYDCVEWTSKEEKKLGFLSPSYRFRQWIFKKWSLHGVKIISISEYLNNYFVSNKVDSLILPNLVDGGELHFLKKKQFKSENKLELLFVGYPHKKDAIDVAVEAIASSNDLVKKINFTIIGIDKKTFYKKYKLLFKYKKNIDECIKFIKFVNHTQLTSHFEKANFTILMRDDKLIVNKSGFPTKFLESLSFSTPVIANITSDLGKYLVNGKNGFIVEEYSQESLKEKLKQILNLSNLNAILDKMSYEAFKTAIKEFDYHKYLSNLEEFINE